MKNISYLPTDGLTYDPEDPRYFDPGLLQKEVTRAFEICHGCRMCFKFCDAFPSLFRFIDERHEGDVRRLSGEETQAVMDACFQCKLCEVQCPYTPRDRHEFQLDLPRLIHRYKAQQRRAQGPRLRDAFLGDPDAAGAMARASLGLINVLNRAPFHRALMEKVLGVHRDKLLPPFARTTFGGWAERAGRLRDRPRAEAVLFPTCYVEHNEPQIGKDTLAVLDRNGVDTACIEGLGCCGMPAWESGDLDTLRRKARANLDVLSPFVAAGATVLAINPTCAMMMRREYPELLAGLDRERAVALSKAVQDPGEYLWSLRNQPRFCTDFQSSPAPPGEKVEVAYHAPCHLRAQAVGFKGRDLLRKIPGVVPKSVMECCGHDGTYAMKVEGFVPSQRLGQRAFDGMKAATGELWATECPLAAIQFQQHAGRKPMHPMSILARAYEPDGFPHKVPRKEAP